MRMRQFSSRMCIRKQWTHSKHRNGAKRWTRNLQGSSKTMFTTSYPSHRFHWTIRSPVFNHKAYGTFKARLVARGWGQVPGVDGGGTFAPVCRIGIIRMVMAIAAEHNLGILQLDVKTAYLQSPVEEDVYVKPAPGYGSQGKVIKLNKSPYGVRQSEKIGSAQLITRWRTSDLYETAEPVRFCIQIKGQHCFYYMSTMF